MSMSVAPDEAIEFTTGSFYEVSSLLESVELPLKIQAILPSLHQVLEHTISHLL